MTKVYPETTLVKIVTAYTRSELQIPSGEICVIVKLGEGRWPTVYAIGPRPCVVAWLLRRGKETRANVAEMTKEEP